MLTLADAELLRDALQELMFFARYRELASANTGNVNAAWAAVERLSNLPIHIPGKDPAVWTFSLRESAWAVLVYILGRPGGYPIKSVTHLQECQDTLRVVLPATACDADSTDEAHQGERANSEEGSCPPRSPDKSRRGVRSAEAEVLIRKWLATNAKTDPSSVTRDNVAKGTGVSTGSVSKSAAWQEFQSRRKADSSPNMRTIQLSDSMRAVISSSALQPDEIAQIKEDFMLASLVAEQEAEMRKEESRQKRRHDRS